jgi:hypothetical protein
MTRDQTTYGDRKPLPTTDPEPRRRTAVRRVAVLGLDGPRLRLLLAPDKFRPCY